MSKSLLEANYKTSGRQLFLTKKEKKNQGGKEKVEGGTSIRTIFICDTL